MALARLITFTPLTLIKSADVNGEFNNILNNPISLISPSTGAINFNLQAHTNLLPTAITATSATAGQALIATTSGGTQFGTAGQAGSGSWVRGLKGTLSSQSGTFSADQYMLQTTDGKSSFVMNSTSGFTVGLGVVGPAANGRDTAAQFLSTYCHWYAISTGFGSTTPAGIVSTATPPNGPVMPTSYSAWTYLGGTLFSSATNTVTAANHFEGAWAFYDAQIAEVVNGNSTVETAVSLSGAAPSNWLEAQHSVQSLLLPGTGNGQTLALRTVSGSNYLITSTTASVVTAIYNSIIRMPNVSNQFFWLLSSQLASANDGVQISIQGYKMPNGDA